MVYKELKTHQLGEPGRAQVPCVTKNFKIPKLYFFLYFIQAKFSMAHQKTQRPRVSLKLTWNP